MIETTISCDGLLSRLGEEIIESYDTGESGADVENNVDALLAFQCKATKITKGTIGVTGTRALAASNKSILASFLQLQESVGGFLYVDNDWKLQWPTDIGENKGQQIRYRKNLTGIERVIDYMNFCTKLYLESSEGQLSDIVKSAVEVDITTDATYAYIILKETYAAYKDWTAEGSPLPLNVTVWKENASPSEITPSSGSGSGWGNVANTYDDNWNSYGTSPGVNYDNWTNYLYLDIASGQYNQLNVKTRRALGYLSKMEIDVYDGAAWTNVYSGSAYKTGYVDFDVQTVERIRIRGKGGGYSYTDYLDVYECHGIEADVTDDTSNWVCGADERTVRCAIGDYDAGSTYKISYTYANYLVAWDKITSKDDLVARVVTNKYEVYAISLLEAGILLLDELKEIPVSYSVRAVDLSRSLDFDFSFDKLQLGSILVVIDEELGIDVSVRVVKLTHTDLLYPERIELELSTRVRDISDYLVDLHKEIS